jgi:pimeloyl-ACP methyl ester carboxylesterase
MANIPNVILIHGAWADGSSWAKVIPLLQAQGLSVTAAAWKSKPSSYLVATRDRAIQPELERTMAKTIRAKTIEVASSHVAMLSHPQETAHLIIEAASR